jgi:hypothetical protein
MDDAAFLQAIDAFLAEAGMKDTAFSRAATGDPNFLRLIRLTNRKTREDRQKRVLAYMARVRRKIAKRAA